MENPSSRNTGTFPDLAIPRADALILKLARQSTGLLRAAEARNKPALVRAQLGEEGEDGGGAAAAAARVFVGADGLRGARVRGEGERVREEECPCGDDAQGARGGRGRRRRRGAEARHGQGEAACTRRLLPLRVGSRRHFQHQRAERVPVASHPQPDLESAQAASIRPPQRSFYSAAFFCRGNPVEGVHVVHARPELAYFTDKNFDMRGCAASLSSMLWEKYDSDMILISGSEYSIRRGGKQHPNVEAKPL